MAKVLISLVSDQTIPNLLLIKELAFIDRFIFISTDKMEKQGRSDWIIDASGIPSDRYTKVKVIEDSPKHIEETLNQIDFDDDDECYVNLTGGTKIMSIGVYNFFRNKRSEIYYIPIGKNICRKIFPEVKQREIKIDFRTDVIQYLKAYGIEIINPKKLNTLSQPFEYTQQFYQSFLESDPSKLDVLNQLRGFRNEKKMVTDQIEGLARFLQGNKFPQCSPGALTKKEVRYLTGEWFEEYVYHLVKAQLRLDQKQIASNIIIRRQGVENEFDVMFTSDNTLHVIECKSSIYDPVSEKNILNESLYKLAALRKDFGLFAQAYLCTLSDRGHKKENISDVYFQRGKLLNIKIIDRTDFTKGFIIR